MESALPVRSTDEFMQVKVDTSAAPTYYVGHAEPGVATSAAGWRIRRVVVSATGVNIAWADGNAEFDNVWDDRASLGYAI